MKTDFFQSCGHCWVFQLCWHIECSTFIASSFRFWNTTAGIPTLPLTFFIVMLPKAQDREPGRGEMHRENRGSPAVFSMGRWDTSPSPPSSAWEGRFPELSLLGLGLHTLAWVENVFNSWGRGQSPEVSLRQTELQNQCYFSTALEWQLRSTWATLRRYPTFKSKGEASARW